MMIIHILSLSRHKQRIANMSSSFLTAPYSNALQTLKEYALDRYLFVYPMLATFSSLSCLSVAIGKEPSSLVFHPTSVQLGLQMT